MGRWTLLVLFLLGCAKNKTPEEGGMVPVEALQQKNCASDADCDQGWVCLAGACADPSMKATFAAPSNKVTPEKVKAHVDQIGADREKRNETVFDKETSPNAGND